MTREDARQLRAAHRALDAAGVPAYGPNGSGAYDAATRVCILTRRGGLRHPRMLRPEWESFRRRLLPIVPAGYACNGCDAVLRDAADLREHWGRGCFDAVSGEFSDKW